MKFKDRLAKVKDILQESSNEKLIFLFNAKDTRIMKGLVAWKNMKIQYDPYKEVPDDATIDDLWNAVSFSNRDYAICLGVSVSQSLPCFRQLRQMNMIFPDGSVDDMCHKLMMTQLKTFIKKVTKEASDKKDSSETP